MNSCSWPMNSTSSNSVNAPRFTKAAITPEKTIRLALPAIMTPLATTARSYTSSLMGKPYRESRS